MRSPPPPALNDVLVSRPGAPSTALIRRDDILAAAALAAEDRATAAPQRTRRSVLSKVQRQWAKISDSLRRRSRASTAASNSAASAAAALATTTSAEHPHRVLANQNEFVAQLDRERALRLEQLEDRDSALEEEMAVCSLREPGSRRVRQVGAREDDDTLLMLPRVASVSFSAADEQPRIRVRQLPRVSGLMPVRAPRPAVSPVSSERSDGSGGGHEEDDDEDAFSDRAEDDIDAEMAVGKRALHRLPTGMSKVDVEREMERAVVEIASEGEEEAGEVKNTRGGRAVAGIRMTGEGRLAGNVMRDRMREAAVTRSVSDVHRDVTRRMGEMKSAFARRASSTTQSRRLLPEENNEAKVVGNGGKDFQLFEDDYLSFQGFHGSGGGYQSMGLLRSRRISSITDSNSEEEDENAVKAVGHMDSKRRMMRRSGISPMTWFKRGGVVGYGQS